MSTDKGRQAECAAPIQQHSSITTSLGDGYQRRALQQRIEAIANVQNMKRRGLLQALIHHITQSDAPLQLQQMLLLYALAAADHEACTRAVSILTWQHTSAS